MKTRNFVKAFSACTFLCASMLFIALTNPRQRDTKICKKKEEKDKVQLCGMQSTANCPVQEVSL